MRIFVQVKAASFQEKIERLDDRHYRVSLRARPSGGKANKALISLLAEHFACAPSCVSIHAGKTAPYKIIDLAV